MRFAFDVDGTIAAWDIPGGFHPTKMGSIMPGAIETLAWIRKRGHEVIIFSCRTNPEVNNHWGYPLSQLIMLLAALLSERHVPFDEIAIFKPDASWFFDDKANFTDWSGMKQRIVDLEDFYEYKPKG